MSDEYKTIVGIAESKLIVKKSRFFGLATSVDTVEASKRFLALLQEKYPNASHGCYAYSIGWGNEKREYATDAGEPRNSAGPPILAAVTASQLSQMLSVSSSATMVASILVSADLFGLMVDARGNV